MQQKNYKYLEVLKQEMEKAIKSFEDCKKEIEEEEKKVEYCLSGKHGEDYVSDGICLRCEEETNLK